jgi:hypothetical protein
LALRPDRTLTNGRGTSIEVTVIRLVDTATRFARNSDSRRAWAAQRADRLIRDDVPKVGTIRDIEHIALELQIQTVV